MTARPRRIFVSYSHKDKKLFTEFKTMLAPAIQGGMEVWDDTRISPGAKWQDDIQAAIAEADIAVLLVSMDFLASPFIANNELPSLLKTDQEQGLTIFWICLNHCLYRHTAIEQFQAAHDVGRPLAHQRKAERQRTLIEICDKLLSIAEEPSANSTNSTDRQRLSPYSTHRKTASPKPVRKQLKTHVVKPGESLADAIGKAHPHERILVHPGTYQGSLVLDKKIEILGAGTPEQVRIEATANHTLQFMAESGRVAKVTLCLRAGGTEPLWSAIDITQGCLILEDCRIESDGVAGIAIHGPNTNPAIRRNRIQGCRQSGVVVFDRAQGTLTDNEICQNKTHGVTIRQGARPILKANRIHHNLEVGVCVEKGGFGHLEGNQVFANGLEGVTISGGSDPLLQSNHIYENTKAGVYVFDSGKGTMESNSIQSNQNSGVAITTKGNPTLKGNSINFNNGKGVWRAQEAAGLLKQDNNLQDNRFGDLWSSPDCSPDFAQ